VYLAPDPDEPFRKLTLAIWQRFPDRPPYGGAYPDIVPHLSVGRFSDAEEMDRVAGELAAALNSAPTVRAYASTAVLIENTTGRWTTRCAFRLAG
jgi:hypothetical protein